MKKQFIPYEQAVQLEKLGFDELCFETSWNLGITDKVNIGLPLWQQAFDWFRVNFGLQSSVYYSKTYEDYRYRIENINTDIKEGGLYSRESETFEEYETAKLECIKYLINYVKNNN